MNQAQYARHRGVDKNAVRRALATGRIKKGAKGIDPVEADKDWANNTDLSKPKNSVTGNPHLKRGETPAPMKAATANGNGNHYAHNRAVREGYAAALAKLEWEKETGKLVPVEDVRKGAYAAGRRIRERMMNMPDRLAAVVAGLSNIHDCRKVIADEVKLALNELHSPYDTDEA